MAAIQKVFGLYECMIVAHVASNVTQTINSGSEFNITQNMDNEFLSLLHNDGIFPVFLMPPEIDASVTSDINDNGRACITSYNWHKLLDMKFSSIWKRPLKILLDDDNEANLINIQDKFTHNELDFISPPLLVWSGLSKSKLTKTSFMAMKLPLTNFSVLDLPHFLC